MDKGQVLQFETLVSHKKAALALACLHEQGPMRWTDVRDGITLRTGTGTGERALNRALKWLVDVGLIEKIGEDGNRLYSLTAQGASQARLAADMFNRLDQAANQPEDETPDDLPDADQPAS